MVLKIKNWSKFQHFKDRRPPWVKLYRDLLDDREWHKLDGDAAKLLVGLWLLASENDGDLLGIEDISFRLRLDETRVNKLLKQLEHWVISERYQDDINLSQKNSATEVSDHQETETETERDRAVRFDDFWNAWPKSERKQDKAKCQAKWKSEKLDSVAELILADVEVKKQTRKWQDEGGKFIEAPLVYINNRRWEDGVEPAIPKTNGILAGAI